MSKVIEGTGIPEAAIGQHTIALGKTGAGKSSKLRVIVEHLLDREQHPVCLLDPKGDWYGLKSSADGKRPGYPIVIFGGAHADVPLTEHAGAEVAELIATGNRSSLIDMSQMGVGERTRFFMRFSESLFLHTRGKRYLAIDEVHNFAPKGKVWDSDAGKMLHWANRLASEGRGKGITLLAASQRPQKVHNDFLTSCETLIACRVIHKADRDAVKDWIDGCADPAIGKEVLAELAQMKRPDAWVWSPEIDFGPKRITFPLFRTFDSFKPRPLDATALKGWAAVDLDEVKAKLSTLVEEAKANDPRELRKEIAALRRELELANTTTVRDATSAAEMAAAVAAARDQERATANLRVEKLIETLRELARGPLEQLAAMFKTEVELPTEPVHVYSKIPVRGVEPMPFPRLPPQRAPRKAVATNGNGADSLTGPQQRVLDALAWYAALGVRGPGKGEVGFIAGYRVGKRVGGTYGNILGQLHGAGLVHYPNPGTVALTPDGEKRAQDPGIGRTNEAVQRAVYDRLDGPERKVLEVLVKTYPDAMAKQELGAAANYQVGDRVGGTFGNILGRLRSLGLIEYPSPGLAVATDLLFPKGRR